MAFAAEDRAGESDKGRLHGGLRPDRDLNGRFDRTRICRKRLVLVLRGHLRELAELPDLDDEFSPRIDDAGEADDQHPHHQNDAGEIMHIEPADHAKAVTPVGSEFQLPHRWLVNNNTRNDRHTEFPILLTFSAHDGRADLGLARLCECAKNL